MMQRSPRAHDPGFLAFLRQKPCCYCGRAAPSEAAHIRYSEPSIGKVNPGMQAKPSDRYAVPLCSWDHREAPDSQHNSGDERKWWIDRGLDPLAIAERLYAEYGGDGGKVKGPRKIKQRAPRENRAKIKGRSDWPTNRRFGQ